MGKNGRAGHAQRADRDLPLQEGGLRYVGKGAFVVGIPARDLTAEEVEALGGEEVLMGTGLYEKVERKSVKREA